MLMTMLFKGVCLMHNIETEKIVLGSIIMYPSDLLYTLEKVNTDDFYNDKHRIIYDSIKALHADNKTITLSTLQVYFTDHKINLPLNCPVYCSGIVFYNFFGI